MSSDLPFHQTTVPPTAPAGKRRHGPLSWHLRKPTQGPASLAIKNHFVAMVGEYVGTTLFLLFALGGTNVANIPTTSVTGAIQDGQDGSQASVANTSNLLYIAFSFGVSLGTCAWIFFRVSGGLFNPAVSWAMLLVGALTPLRAALLTVSQLLGGITAAAILHAIVPGTLNVRTLLAPGVSIARGLFIEMFLTAILMLTILLLAAEKHKATFLAPIGIGMALFIAELFGVFYTGGSLNPARSFGPSVVLRAGSNVLFLPSSTILAISCFSCPSLTIYWVGPALGTTLAAGFYRFIKYLEYETVLGPEDPVPASQLPAPPATLLGATSSSAQAPTTSMAEKPVPPSEQTGTADVQGPGLADLLTAGPTEVVYSLPHQPSEPYDQRFDRIEALLAQLVNDRQGVVTGLKGSPPGGKMSIEGTLVGEPQGQHDWHADSPV
ncbi:hypothetical protein JCM10213_007219 [Rhodosporidiobolus nylandii]